MALKKDMRAIWLVACAAMLIPVSGQSQSPIATDSGELQEVVVTGSRFARSAVDATGPITIVDRADFERAAADSIGRVLQALPLQNGATQNANSNGDGTTRINLRGLGPERTLVLLNGRRFVFGGLGADSSVDLDMIPLSMIDRVEISTSGAAAIYGSDAIAGVVNVITRRHYSGAEAETRFHTSERGDGQERGAHALLGLDSPRGNLTFGAEYARADGVLQTARAFSAHVESLASPAGPVIQTGSIYSTGGLFIVPEPNALDPSGLGSGLYTRVAGGSGRGADAFRAWDKSSDLFDYAPYAYLQTPQERGVGWLSAQFDFGSSIEAFAEGLLHRSRSREQIEPTHYSSFNVGAAPVDPATQAQFIPANNFYNPFGVDVGVLRTLLEAGPRTYDQRFATGRMVVGLRGRIERWQWEGSVTWAQSDTDDSHAGQILRAPARSAVGPSGRDAAGNVACGVPDPATGIVPAANVIAGCIPLDLFGPEGSVTPKELAYVSRTLRNLGTNRHWVGDFSLTGPLGRLPAGDLQWAVGAQYRRESAGLVLDPQTGEGVAGEISAGVPDPSTFTARDLFVELQVPLLRGARAAEALDATFGARSSHYSAFGGRTTLQAGLRWRMNSQITLRGGYSQVFRAPSLGDLFTAQIGENRAVNDPCGNSPTPEQQRNCAAAGVPGGRYQQGMNAPVLTLFGGNPRLGPESGNTWTAGVLFSDAQSRYTTSIDFWRVQLSNLISFVDPLQALRECVNVGNLDACRFVQRDASGAITFLDGLSHNLSHQTEDGVDIAAGARWQLPRGELNAHVSAVLLHSVALRSFFDQTPQQLSGTYDSNGNSWPRWRVQGTFDWVRGPWRVSYTTRFIHAMSECGDKNFYPFLDSTDCRRIDARIYHDVSATYGARPGWRVSLAVDNLTDTAPPRINQSGAANTDPTIYDVLGRAYTLALAYDFR